MFVPGPTTLHQTNQGANGIDGAGVTNWQNDANGFQVALDGAAPLHLALMVLSRKLGVATAVVNIRMDTVFHVQRRRFETVARH